MFHRYDLIVISAENGGLMTACRAHQLSVAIVKRARERDAEFHFNAEIAQSLAN